MQHISDMTLLLAEVFANSVQCHKVTTPVLVGPLFQPSGCVYIYSRGRNKRSLKSSLWITSKMDFTEAYSDRCSTAGRAARSDSIKCLQRLIKRGNSIDVPDNRGWMPIHEAAFYNSSKCLKLLLQAAPSKMYIKAKTFDGETALHLSAKRGAFESTKILLQAGADPNEPTNDETTALFLAVENEHADVVRLLLEHGANVNGSHSCSGWNALHQASFQASVNLMKLLLEQGVDKEWQDDFGITPLFVAAQYGKLESLKLLLSQGANVNCQVKDKATPLFITSQEGHCSCAEVLLTHGADPNLYCNDDNWQLPIHAAAQMGHTKVLELLVPVTDKICDTGEGQVSPVYSAVYGGKEECLEMLLKEGYSPDAQYWDIFNYSSPLCVVFQSKTFEVVPILLKYGASVTGIHLGLCLDHQRFTLFRLFLERGCLLPCGKHLRMFRRIAAKAHSQYKEWLPHLLLAGFNPRNLLRRSWICCVNNDALNFTLEFTNCTRLPPAMERILFVYAETSTWVPKEHFGSIPSLSHLCRLEIRKLLRSENLRSDQHIRQLPLPTCLQDFLLYKDILRTYSVV